MDVRSVFTVAGDFGTRNAFPPSLLAYGDGGLYSGSVASGVRFLLRWVSRGVSLLRRGWGRARSGVTGRAVFVLLLVAALVLGGWLVTRSAGSGGHAQDRHDPPPVRMAAAPADQASPVAVVRSTDAGKGGSGGSDSLGPKLDAWVGKVSERTGVPAEAMRGYAKAELALRSEDPNCHLSWVTLAGMGTVATTHGNRNNFTRPDVTAPKRALSAARSLCSGSRDLATADGWWAAIRSVHDSDLYLERVLAYADLYGTLASRDAEDAAAPDGSAVRAVRFAIKQLGLPYVWGGNGPQQGQAGFDCSGLTKAAYAAADVSLPRTADSQFRAVTPATDGKPRLGDLVFYGDPHTNIHHVGIYVGNGQMINAPDFGMAVQVAAVRHSGDDYAGAGRPAA